LWRPAFEFHLHPGAPHGFGGIASKSAVAQKALNICLLVIGSVYRFI